jgi:hypothetical protein
VQHSLLSCFLLCYMLAAWYTVLAHTPTLTHPPTHSPHAGLHPSSLYKGNDRPLEELQHDLTCVVSYVHNSIYFFTSSHCDVKQKPPQHLRRHKPLQHTVLLGRKKKTEAWVWGPKAGSTPAGLIHVCTCCLIHRLSVCMCVNHNVST